MVDNNIVNLDKVRKVKKLGKKGSNKKLKPFDIGDLLKCDLKKARKMLEGVFPGHNILEVIDGNEKKLLIRGPKLNCILTARKDL
tara:strand:- start:343 stop:597 length:255 start_codon:yes stop_codon:yes gene_type:complete